MSRHRNHDQEPEQRTTTTPPRETQPALVTPEEVIRGWWNNHTHPDQPPTGTNTPTPLIVWWWDAISYGTDNWTDHTDTPEPAPTITIGWLTHNTPHAITLVPLINNEQWGHGITIPWGCIHHTTPHTTPPPHKKHTK